MGKMLNILLFLKNILRDLILYFTWKKRYGAFCGVFNSFEEAYAKILKPLKGKGFSEENVLRRYIDYFNDFVLNNFKIAEYEYPIFLWLYKIMISDLNRHFFIFDFGGGLGRHYYSFKYFSGLNNFFYVVCELEDIVKIAKNQEILPLEKPEFTTDFSRATGCDIFIAIGSIQYWNMFFPSFSSLESKPKHVLIGRLPVNNYPKNTIVTLQNIGGGIVPHYVFNENFFKSEFMKLGYELIDEWPDRLDKCIIPFHRDKSANYYKGFYFKLKEY